MDREHLPEGWEVKKIKEIGKVQTGSTPKTSDKNKFGNDIPFIKPPDFLKDGSLNYENQGLSKLGTKEARIIDKDSVLMVCIGATIGKVGFTEKEVTANQQINSLTPLNGDYPKFIFYQMLTKNFQQKVLDSSGQATLPIINKTKWSELSLFLPFPDEQKRIMAILDEAFEGIDQAIRNTEKNLANARELFDSYLNKIFTQKGDIWDEKRLADIAEVQSGGTPSRSKSNYWGGEMAWYSSGELNDLYTNKPERTITDEGLVNSNAKLFPKSSLLVGMYDTAALKMSILDREATFNQAIAGVKPNKKIDLVFILHAINFVKPEILSLRRGVRQKNLSLQKIKDISITIPDLEEQKKVVLQLASIKKETQRLETIYRQKLAALNELKQSILQKAFTGQLTSKNC
jgi:type I restriction enzyme S subunit